MTVAEEELAIKKRHHHRFVGAQHLKSHIVNSLGFSHLCYACGKPDTDPDHDGDVDQPGVADSDAPAPAPSAPSVAASGYTTDKIHLPTTSFSKVSPKTRARAAERGEAMPDGSFPVKDASDLRRAIAAYGRAKDKAAAKRHIIRRARALDKVDLLPEAWKVAASQEFSHTPSTKKTPESPTEKALREKATKHNAQFSDEKQVSLPKLRTVYRRGLKAASAELSSILTPEQQAQARVNSFLRLVATGEKTNPEYTQDDDLLASAPPPFSNAGSEAGVTAALDTNPVNPQFELLHPRDRHGEWITKGGAVKIHARDGKILTGVVDAVASDGSINVTLKDGSKANAQPHQIEAVSEVARLDANVPKIVIDNPAKGTRARQALLRELDAQGYDSNGPLRGAINSSSATHTIVARNPDGSIVGAVSYLEDGSGKNKSLHLTQMRVLDRRQGTGQRLIARMAQEVGPNGRMTVGGAVPDAKPFYAKTGASFVPGLNHGEWSRESIDAMKRGESPVPGEVVSQEVADERERERLFREYPDYSREQATTNPKMAATISRLEAGTDLSGDDAPAVGPMRPATPEDRARLKIPPAWTDVVVAENPTTPLQAKGLDSKRRPQYRYTDEHHAKQAEKKFARMRELHKVLPQLDAALARDANTDGTAAAVYLMRTMGVRNGSETDTGAKTFAYGATNLRARHVLIDGNNVTLDFDAKDNVHLTLPVTDERLKEILRARVAGKSPDDPIFGTDESKTNAYLKTHTGNDFMVKDLRTYFANSQALSIIASMPKPQTDAEFKKARREVAVQVSKLLGNTPAVVLGSYLNPAVFNAWVADAPWV